MKATLGFFALPNVPVDVVNPLLDSLISYYSLMCNSSYQILNQIFSISLSLPKPMDSNFGVDIELSYSDLSSLEDVIAVLRSDASIDPSEVFNNSSICILLAKIELVAALNGCTAAICDKIKLSSEGAIQAVVEFVSKREKELSETDIFKDSPRIALCCGSCN